MGVVRFLGQGWGIFRLLSLPPVDRPDCRCDGGSDPVINASSLSRASWRKSSYSSSNGGDCLEVAGGFLGVVPVRDSKDPHGPALVFRADGWASFVSSVKGGEFSAF
ncbi:DUF397 domain-containing protein [Streptomyces celluloflavus]|uniref:DUF397 domain-containing protein n=1 Tax=Streptomyces celluloflavus TaxID=58344 RepID=UPI0036CBDD21